MVADVADVLLGIFFGGGLWWLQSALSRCEITSTAQPSPSPSLLFGQFVAESGIIKEFEADPSFEIRGFQV